MVTIKKLELMGFKTFATKTSISFDKHLNVVLGPNGSGKTNIVDAVQFVLGELSARNLRATNFSSLLFSGNSEVSKANRAVVTVQFDNSARRIPVDTDVVTISRYINARGESIYRVNGKRYSRGSLIDMLGVAALTGGMNIITQGTTMKIADYSPEDRRKNIEGIIGISEYDKKKQEAQTELHEAEVNLKVAVGKYEEVRKRLIELEKERNDLLRYNYVKNELNRLKAVKLSARIKTLQAEIEKLNREADDKTAQIAKFKSERESLEAERHTKEMEWQDFAVKVVDKGGQRLLALQKEIGDLNSEIAGLNTTLSSAKTSLKSYEIMRADRIESSKATENQLTLARKEIRKLTKAGYELEDISSKRQKCKQEIVDRINEIARSLDENTAKLSSLEEQVEKLEGEHRRLEVNIKADKESCDILADQIQVLGSRGKAFEELHNGFSTQLRKVEEIKRKELQSLKETLEAVERAKRQAELAESEIGNAEKMAKEARLSVAEFESRKDLADTVLSEEKALEHIENLVQIKALTGVHGRLGEKVRVTHGYRKAAEATAEGWFHALVVENMDVVRKCAESLRRARVGRVKLLPLAELREVRTVKKPDLEGIVGLMTSFVECPQKYKPAVNFVLGDTLIATSEEAALSTSRQGYRTVTVDGEVYEPGLRLELGFYREPVDLSEVLPSDASIKAIRETVLSFEHLLERREAELKRLGNELMRLERDKILREDTIKYFERDIADRAQSIERAHKGIVELNRRLRSFTHRHEKTRTSIGEAEARRSEIEQQLHTLRVEAANIRKKLKPEAITRLESEKASLEAEINDIQRQLNECNSKLSMYESNITNIYLPSLNLSKKDLSGINNNIRNRLRDIESANRGLSEALSRLKKVEDEKEELSARMTAEKQEYKKFTDVIQSLGKDIKKIDRELEPLNDVANNLKQELLKHQLELERSLEELRTLGYEQPFEAMVIDVATPDSLVDGFREEFNSLAVKLNMNAVILYEPQKRNYKEVSERINQLEEEKREIINFMETVERDKRDAFFSALEKLNKKFSESFNAITNGKGWLQLQNPEDPFSGGLDIIVEFPGKSPILVTAASGGEKSVVAVSYIFALQSLTESSPFYIFDEIDAHLDPVNVQRLADLLSKESRNSQMLVISFKEPIAAKANRIFGVFARNGVSNLLSLPTPMLRSPA